MGNMADIVDAVLSKENLSSNTPRLITADELNTIVGGVSTWDVNDYETWFFFEGTGTNNQTKPTYDSSNRSSYDWLYNNLNKYSLSFSLSLIMLVLSVKLFLIHLDK